MSVKNFVNYFVEESIRKMSLANLYDSDLNQACFNLNVTPIDITPDVFLSGNQEFSYNDPAILNIYPSVKDSEKYLLKTEQFIEALHNINKQAVFEIRGNKENITCSFYAQGHDIDIIDTSLKNYFPNSITYQANTNNISGDFHVYDFLPEAPFYKSLTSPDTFIISPLNMIPKVLTYLDKKETGIYQVIFTPLPATCHKMVEEAIDCEWRALHGSDKETTPSLQATSINKRIEYKAPEFRSYYSASVRLILPTETLSNHVKAFIASFSYGSKSFKILDNSCYTKEKICSMVNSRDSFHKGFLVNSHELTSLLHIPFQILKNKEFDEIFAIAPVGDKPILSPKYEDVAIGEWACGQNSVTIHLPNQRQIPNVHMIGLPRTGKSTLLNTIALEKFRNGEAVIVIDHHGELIDTIKKNIPSNLIENVVVIDFGLPDLIPKIMIRSNVDITNPSKVSDDLSSGMRDITSSREKYWGPRMSYTFQCLYFIYSVLPDIDLAQLRLLISPTKKGKNLRIKVKTRIKHPIVIDFLEELDSIPTESILPVMTRLSHLLLDENSLRLFTMSDNKISIPDILDNGKLCLINLACGIIGKQRSSILGGLMNSIIINNAFSRASIPYEQRKPATVIIDEFHLGPYDLDLQMTSIAKYNCHYIFAHQYLNQLEDKDIDALATAGTKVIFKLGQRDAEIMGKNLNNITPYDLTALRSFQAFVKIEDEIVKINTPRPTFNNPDYSEEIMKNCISKYYMKYNEDTEPKPKQEFLIDEI